MSLAPLGLLALAAAATTGLEPGPAPQPEPIAAAPLRLWDGYREVLAWRRGPPDAHGLAPVVLDYPSLGVSLPARIGRRALLLGSTAGLEGARLVRALMPRADLWLVEPDAAHSGEDALDLAARLRGAPGVRSVFPDLWLARRPAYVPDDPQLGSQWYFARLDMESAWDLERGSPAVTIVANDTGCDAAHPDLATQLDQGRDVIDADDDPTYNPGDAGSSHGTAVAGLLAAATDNGIGIAGACPLCRLRCVRLIDTTVAIPLSADVDAFAFADTVDAAVISNSWGYVDVFPVPQGLATAIESVYDGGRGGLGAVVLFASGNDDREVFDYELLGVRGVVGVGAVDQFDRATQFTNFGASLDVCAPAGSWTTDIHGAGGSDPGDYATFGGTSSACPIAAGVAALIAAASPTLRSAQIEAELLATARPAPLATPDANGHDPIYGYGIVDPVAALDAVLGIGGAGGGGGAAGSGGGASGSGGGGTSGSGGGGSPPGGCAAGAAAPAAWLVALLLVRRLRRG